MCQAPSHLAASPELSALWRTCYGSLPKFRLPDAGILARRIIWDGTRFQPFEPSPRNTAEVLKALYRMRSLGCALPLEPRPLLETLVEKYLEGLDYADVALIIWADALGDCLHVRKLWEALRERLPGKASETMELSWTLSAVCQLHQIDQRLESVEGFAQQLYARITRNQSQRTGLFGGSSGPRNWPWRRDNIASLSSQTYAIQAMTLYGQTFGVHEAVERGRKCADAICSLQGTLGQWWWTYDVRKSTVVQRYPVYSVNQDAAIPTALGILQGALQESRYDHYIMRGIAWLFGENEARVPLVDETIGVIWRCMECDDQGTFAIKREMFSYHPARCLFWLCDATSPVRWSDYQAINGKKVTQ